jgi:hypothetical protein
MKFMILFVVLAVSIVSRSSGSTRVYGIIGQMMGQEKCIVNFENLTFDELYSELTERIKFVWKNKITIRKDLVIRSNVARKLSLSNFDFIEQLLDENRVETH